MKNKLIYVTNNIKSLRNRVGLKQEEVANLLGVSRITYCSYETTPQKVTIEILYKLSSIFKCRLSDFFTEIDVTLSNSVKETEG